MSSHSSTKTSEDLSHSVAVSPTFPSLHFNSSLFLRLTAFIEESELFCSQLSLVAFWIV
jgi:hypothetical protein